MSRRVFSLTAVFFLVVTAAGLAQEASLPAATRSQGECSGFVAGSPESRDVFVLDGADDDYRTPVRQFTMGDFVYLSSHSSAAFSVGSEYRIIRPAREPRSAGFFAKDIGALYSFSRVPMYPGQGASIRSLGTPYEDVGIVKVRQVAPEGAIADVTFACSPIYASDLAVPYQARVIPGYTPSTTFDRFAPPDGKRLGAITAAPYNLAFLGAGNVAYVNLGSNDGVSAGQRFRIFKIFRESNHRVRSQPATPRETIGEMIILSTQEKSSVGMVINSVREISAGDGVELE